MISPNIKELILFMLCMFFVTTRGVGQNQTIQGKVLDKSNGESIIGAVVVLYPSKSGGVTNTEGYFSFITKEQDHKEIRVQCMGYDSKTIPFNQIKNGSIQVELSPSTQEIGEVKVTGAQRTMTLRNAQVSAHTISPKQIENLPSLAGEKDIIKAIQMLPGVSGGSEGSSSLIVRGGSPDQNLFLIDNVPVYNASHVLGLFSIFTPEAIRNVDFYKGGFSAEYGGRLSSVVDISMKEGNRDHITGDISIGTISSKGLIEGPINGGKGAFMFTGRRTYIDLLMQPFIKNYNNKNANSGTKEDTKFTSYFYDMTGKITYSIAPNTKAYFSIYKGTDQFGVNNKSTKSNEFGEEKSSLDMNINWGNLTSSLRLNQIHSSRWYSNLTVYSSMYEYLTKMSSEEDINTTIENNKIEYKSNFKNNYTSKVTDWGLKYDSRLLLSASNKIKWGMSGVYHQFTPGKNVTTTTDESGTKSNIQGTLDTNTKEGAAFIEWETDPNYRWKLKMGLRYAIYQAKDKLFQYYEPRVAIRYLASDFVSLKASYSLMNQPIHLLSQNNFALGTSIWVPATVKIPPSNCQQFTVGALVQLSPSVSFSIEGWAKKMTNQIDFKYGVFESSEHWEDEVTRGDGRAYGMDVLLKKDMGKTTGWIAYTLSRNERNFAALNNGNWFPYRYDRTHDFSLVLQHKFSKNIEFGANYILSSGYPITIPTSYYTTTEGSVGLIVPKMNNKRMKLYHRLDCSISFHKDRKRGRRTWTFGAYNVYARKNPYNYTTSITKPTDGSPSTISITEYSLFSIIPSITYRFNFK
ncbi:TonB-dependent receptor [Halosquirtibacter laminarini]|uniref:TonB-dependent receptor n=1 Tax=Halosquirtibacter laminarini TaxID=3374600 RepID=A0AC61NHQ3_9BACT|nr:TonB-dependent receptor [Prolixibacteraceae bacterium]